MKKLVDIIQDLNLYEQQRVYDFIVALKRPCEEWITENSEWMNEKFAREFRSRLLTQHAFQDSPLFQDTFESTFIASVIAGGKECRKAPDGERFWDVEVEGKKISLKSTKAKSLSKKKLKISKLTEAAWIQDCRSAATREEYTKALFREYTSTVSSIIQLRYFRNERFYEMVEIPIILLAPILDVPRSYFASDGPSIHIPIGQIPEVLTLKLDRSDAKITLNNIRKECCNLLGTWKL